MGCFSAFGMCCLQCHTNEHSKESPFFLMLGREPVLPLNTLLGPKMRYLGNDVNVLSLEAMKKYV